MGATGFVTGAHLHFEIRINGKAIDPTPYMNNTQTIPNYEESITGTGESTYIVKSGDTLSAIAQKYGTTYQILAKVNGIPDANKIYISQVIRIPSNNVNTRKVKVIATRGLNCRKGAGTNYNIVKAYNYGAELEIFEEQNGWWKTSDGWVSLNFVQYIN